MNPASEPRRSGGVPRRWSATWALALLLPFLLSVAVAMTPAAATPSTWEQLGGDIASLVALDESGKAVAIDADGSRVAVGAPEHDGSKGTVRIYDWDGSSWTQVGSDIDGEAAGDQSGTAVSLSSDGSRVAIGAVHNDGVNGTDSGHVRVYDWNGSSWIQVGVDIDGEAAGDRSGYRAGVSISGNGTRVAIGASHNGGNGVDSGHVRVYEYSSGSWSQLGSDIDGESAGDLSGRSVSLDQDGSRVAIGAVHNDGNGVDSGHVRIYDWDAGSSSWVQSGADIDGEAAGDEMGFAVSLSANGSRLAAGAAKHDGNRGHVRIYDWDADSSSWVQSGADIDGEAAGDEMGSAVALSTDGSRLAVGAALNDGNGSNSGHVRIFDWNGSSWIQSGTDIDGDAADDVLGRAVALSANGLRVAVGAPGNNGAGENSGHARVHVATCSPTETSYTSGSTDYTVVTFDAVGTCNWTVPDGVTSVDVLVVGGGGGGGALVGGGGGGGGVTFSPNVTVTPSGSIPVTVGAGGAGAAWSGGTGNLTLGANGSSSSFGSPSPVTALGGGVGASNDAGEFAEKEQPAGTGSSVASGGGSSRKVGGGGTGATSDGGSAASRDLPHAAGGGGGAGGDGENGTGDASSGTGGAGGPGGISDITGKRRYYGGGGGGGVHGFWNGGVNEDEFVVGSAISVWNGGAGGGGAGRAPDPDDPGVRVNGQDGTDGLGGGGGGAATLHTNASDGGDGGSGVVIVRYPPAACSPTETSYTSGSTAYTVVTFNGVGTCNWTVPAAVTSVDVLVVGGGGGGGAWVGGGGGGGGVTFSTNVTVTPGGSIPVIVGAGGAGASKAPDSLTSGANGASSSFGSASPVTALGGGVGASWDAQAAGTGSSVASGGGGSQDSGTNSGTFAGGTGDTTSGGSAGILDQPHPTGGGGGAGGNGQDGTGVAQTSGAAGAGGVGAVSDITGTSIYYGGGGGGGIHGTWTEPGLLEQDTTPGAGGTGGGGAGGAPDQDDQDAVVNGQDGTDGLGGGGGGGATHGQIDSSGGDGGSGVVIVRYTLAMATCSPETTSYTSGSTIYTVLAFKDVGTCSWAIPSGVSKFDWLVVGGGGGGGSWHGAGGGAGGMRSSEGLNVALDTSFTIQVGAGGDGAPIPGETSTRGSSGGASRIIGSSSGVLASVLGGGGGGTGANQATDGNDGGNGGSGGGSQAALHYGGTAGLGTSGEGNSGGAGSGGGVRAVYVGGGGGGYGAAASGAGEDENGVTAGSGGDGGTVSWISASVATALSIGEVVGSDVYFAGGGAGAVDEAVSYTLGTGGLGGGGDGRSYADGAGEDGAASTGGGGAGSSLSDDDETRVGGTGGSGVVVLRYGQPAPVTLTYDARGGSGGPGDTTGAPDSTVSVSSTVPTRSGYTFAGWNTQADGSGTAYAAGDTYTLPSSGTVTLHAQWQVVETVTAPPSPADELTDPSESSTPPAPTSSESTPARPSPLVPEAPEPQVPAEGIANQAPPEPSELAVERLVASVDPAPGETVTVTADGFEPDEPVGVHLVTEEEVRAVASTVAAADGAVRVEFVIPSGTCGDLVLVVWAPGSGVGFRQDLNVTGCGLDKGPDVVQVEIASDGAVADGGQGGRLAWWVFALGSVVAVTVIASARRAVDSRRRSGIADTA